MVLIIFMENKLKSPMVFYRPDFCFECNCESIEIYDFFNKPLRYSDIIESRAKGMDTGILNHKAVYLMRCKNCNKVFPIKWINGFPYPVWDNRAKQLFVNKFAEESKQH